jgi:hypothetical protein
MIAPPFQPPVEVPILGDHESEPASEASSSLRTTRPERERFVEANAAGNLLVTY